MGTLERRRREKDARRREILDAARSLFWRRGFAGTTMPDVARAVELAPGTLYLYFPGKDALYAELLIEGYDRLLTRLQRSVRGRTSARRRGEALVDGFLAFARQHPAYFDIIFFLLQRETPGGPRRVLTPEQLARLEERETACKAIAAQVVKAADPRRSVKEVALFVEATWSMLVGVVSIWGKDDDFPQVAKRARRILVDGLLGAA